MSSFAETLPPLTPGGSLPRPAGGPGFKLLALVTEAPGLNVYRAYDLQCALRCFECGNHSPVGSTACTACGADLTEARPTNHVVFLHESARSERLGSSIRLALQPVRHPHLLTPLHAQQVVQGAVRRYYVATPERPAPSLAEQRGPHAALTVLKWGQQLAAALAQLHAAGITHGEISDRHILIRGGRAWLVCEPGGTAPQNRPTASDDVCALARLLLAALTGSDDPPALAHLPGPIREALDLVLAADGQDIANASTFAHVLADAADALGAFALERIQAGWATHPGQRREANEDSVAVIQFEAICADVRAVIGIFIVADGAGGHAEGELASQTAVQVTSARLLVNLLPAFAGGTPPAASVVRAIVADAIADANTRLRALRQERGGNMLTTLVLALVRGRQVLVASIGDSRGYVYAHDVLKQVTADHTLVARLVALGQLTPEQAHTHPKASHLYRGLGQADVVETDFFELLLAPGDRLLLCSDGLHGQLTDKQIAQTLRQTPDPARTAPALIEAANAAGGKDNITAIVVRP